MGGIVGEIDDLVGVGFAIEEHLDGFGVEHLGGGAAELAGFPHLAPLFVGEHFVAVVVVEAVWDPGLEAAEVLKFSFSEGADEVVFFVHAIGVAEGLVALIHVGDGDAFAEEGLAIDASGLGDAGELEDSGAEIDEADETGDAVAEARAFDEVLEVLGHADDERHVEAGFVGVAFAARHHATVIAEVEDEGVLEHAVGLELGDGVGDDAVDDLLIVEVAGVGVAEERRVRVVGGEFDGCRVMARLDGVVGLCVEVQRALVRLRMGLHVEERLLGIGPVAPVGVFGGVVPDLLHVHLGVVVGLRVVAGVVAGTLQVGGDHFLSRRHWGHRVAAVELGADPRAVAHRGERGAGDGTNGRIGESVVKSETVGGQRLDRWGFRTSLEEMPEVVDGIVLGNDPNDVGPVGGQGGRGR